MRASSLDLLEFDALKELLGRYVSSPLGHAELERLVPGSDRVGVEEQLAETAEAISYFQAAARPQPAARGAAIRLRFSDLPDPGPSIAKLRIEGEVLDPKEVLRLTELLDRAADIRAVLIAVGGRFPRLAEHGARIGEFRSLLHDLAGKIEPDGTVADDASVALNRIRRDIDRQRKLIQDTLERFLRAHREEGVLQEEFVTIRNERFVVPVIAGQKRKIEGVIHGASGTGHTLFIEPLETIELNNELVRLTEEELQEVHRILRDLTARLRDYSGAIERTAQVLGELEWLFAKASFAMDFGATIPRFGQPGTRRLKLRDARHPLLEDVLRRRRQSVVPASLEMHDRCRTLLISGPNSGGKTVTLKTVGLLALMAQAGLPVTAADAEFPFFDQVLADIGDNQSIQESLSTFSAHTSRVRDMIAEATPDSLVLLDELGRATDPEEGGALGIAVLEHFRGCGSFTLASTHLLALKVYGGGTEGVLNGSMGFDEQTLEPTYVLHLGSPGKSAGLDIAQRLGMPARIIERARAALSTRDQDLAAFLAELHGRLDELAALQRSLDEERRKLAEREEVFKREWARREELKLKELERRTALVLEKFEGQARQVLEQIQAGAAQRKAADEALRRVARVKRELREELDATVLSTQTDARQGELEQPKIEPGARVRLKGIREPARVRRVIDGERIEVEAGALKMQVSRDDVLEVLRAAEGRGLPQGVSFKPAPQAYAAIREINVIGERAEAAIERVQKFLDTAILADVDHVRIVHGHGMGVLRRAIAELLSKHPDVARFYPAEQHEGGSGATIVEFKE